MASPITHAILTQKVFDKLFSEKNKKEFFIGTCFPDIRYLGVVKREETHFDNVTLKEVLSLDSFNAGLKFHSLVDEVRETYLIKKNYYSFFPKSELKFTGAKVLEDRILYDKVSQSEWKEIAGYFNKTDANEGKFGILQTDINKWHGFLQAAFLGKPNEEHNIKITLKLGFPRQRAEEINNVIRNSDVKKATQIILNFYNDFESLL